MMDLIRAFLSKLRTISLNMPKYPWKCLKKLFWLCQGSEYAWSSYMFDRLLKVPPILNKRVFWIWHGCICKGYVEFQICLIVDPYTSIMPEYAWICLNMAQYCWMSLNMPENTWINCSGYATVLSVPRYNYNNMLLY